MRELVLLLLVHVRELMLVLLLVLMLEGLDLQSGRKEKCKGK